jgi:hypothetical protein
MPSSMPRCDAMVSAIPMEERHEKILKGALPIMWEVLNGYYNLVLQK